MIIASAIALAILSGSSLVKDHWFADPNEVWRTGEAELRSGRIDAANAALIRLTRLRHPTAQDRMFRGQVRLAQGRIDEGLASLSQVPDGHPMAAQARLMAGQFELRRHRARFAEHCFREALRLDPLQARPHRELIYILGYQLRRAELAAEFEALSQLTDLSFENVFHWSLMQKATWQPETAYEELTRFIEADPEDRWSRLALAENYRRAGLRDEAETVIAGLPDSDPEALAIRVKLALDRHQDVMAEQLLRSSTSEAPALARLCGRLALSRRDAPTAIRWFRIAEADPIKYRDVLFGLANAFALAGDKPSADAMLQKAKDLDLLYSLIERASATEAKPTPSLLTSLGAACASVGRDAEARAWYKLTLVLDPLNAESQQALFRLESRLKARNEAQRWQPALSGRAQASNPGSLVEATSH